MANVWFPGVRFSTDAPSVPNALHGTVPAFTPPLPFASGSTKIVTLFTLAAAQVLPSNVQVMLALPVVSATRGTSTANEFFFPPTTRNVCVT